MKIVLGVCNTKMGKVFAYGGMTGSNILDEITNENGNRLIEVAATESALNLTDLFPSQHVLQENLGLTRWDAVQPD